MGAKIRHLEKAPIAEALIDIRVQAREGLDASAFEQVREHVGGRYPKVRQLQTFQAQVGVQEGQVIAPTASRAEAGLLFYAVDEKTVVQFRLDGFTFNKLYPYSSWAEIYPETMRLWEAYRNVAVPVLITRLGVRYINRLSLPSAEFGRYLSALPQLPPELPQEARSFLTRVVLYDEQRSVSASLTQAFESPIEAPAVSVLLDIDAFKDLQSATSHRDMEAVLASLHELKNEIFFGSITEETARMYE